MTFRERICHLEGGHVIRRVDGSSGEWICHLESGYIEWICHL